jgi:lipoprotein NlpI
MPEARMSARITLPFFLLFSVAAFAASAHGDSSADLQKQATEAWSKGEREHALELAGRAMTADPKSAQAPYLRARMRDALGRYADAVSDFGRCVEIDPKFAEAYDQRGSSEFKLGKFAEAVADFDRFLALRPAEKPGHWRRGIALYYVGRFADARDQFKGYESVDTNDVENAVWHFLCSAKLEGVTKAQKAMLKIGKDRRVPMTEVYELYRGKLKPADVLAAAEAGAATASERKDRLFYAHLYLGLYYDALGDAKSALEHMNLAAGKYRSQHYMGDVARVHAEVLRTAAKTK